MHPQTQQVPAPCYLCSPQRRPHMVSHGRRGDSSSPALPNQGALHASHPYGTTRIHCPRCPDIHTYGCSVGTQESKALESGTEVGSPSCCMENMRGRMHRAYMQSLGAICRRRCSASLLEATPNGPYTQTKKGPNGTGQPSPNQPDMSSPSELPVPSQSGYAEPSPPQVERHHLWSTSQTKCCICHGYHHVCPSHSQERKTSDLSLLCRWYQGIRPDYPSHPAGSLGRIRWRQSNPMCPAQGGPG
jgi:hypothetical protein